MANPWFRMYHEFAVDPKVQMLSEIDQRRYLMLLCLRCCNGDVTLHETAIAFQLRISLREWAETRTVLQAANLIDTESKPTNWDKRQMLSDSSRERVAAFRARQPKLPKRARNVTVTAQDTDTDTDKELKAKSKALSASAAPKRFDAGKYLIELAVPETVAQDWLALRRSKKAPATQTAIDGVMREAAKANLSPHSALELCCARGWQGFKADWLMQDARAGPTSYAQKRDEERAAVGDFLTGRKKTNERVERDITGESFRVA